MSIFVLGLVFGLGLLAKPIINEIKKHLWFRKMNNAVCPACESERLAFYDLSRSESQLICLDCKKIFDPTR